MSTSIINYAYKRARALSIWVCNSLNIIIESHELISTELEVRIQHELQRDLVHNFMFQFVEST